MRMPHPALLSLGLSAGVLPLGAEDIRLEAQIGTAIPSGTLRSLVESQAGFTLGAGALLDFQDGHALRPRLEMNRWKGTGPVDLPGAGASRTTRIQSFRLGADYLHFFLGTPDQGPYALGGLALAWNRRQADLQVSFPGHSGKAGLTQNPTRLAWNLGLGYQFTPVFGLEAGYHATSLGAGNLVLPLEGPAGPLPVNAPQAGGVLGHWSLRAVLRF